MGVMNSSVIADRYTEISKPARVVSGILFAFGACWIQCCACSSYTYSDRSPWDYLKPASVGLPAALWLGRTLIVANGRSICYGDWDDEFIKVCDKDIVRMHLRRSIRLYPHVSGVGLGELQILLESQKLVICDLAGLEGRNPNLHAQPDNLEGMVSLVVNEVEVYLNTLGVEMMKLSVRGWKELQN